MHINASNVRVIASVSQTTKSGYSKTMNLLLHESNGCAAAALTVFYDNYRKTLEEDLTCSPVQSRQLAYWEKILRI